MSVHVGSEFGQVQAFDPNDTQKVTTRQITENNNYVSNVI